MSEMVERVARAIERERWRIAIEQTQGAKISSPEGSRRAARAAIEAMLEPTDEMVAAGLAQKDECEDGGHCRAACVIEHAWPKMIDAALTGTTAKPAPAPPA